MVLTKTRARIASAVVAGLMLASQFAAPLSVGATNFNHKINICHGTASYTNPYTKINVDKDAADGNGGNDNGQGDHYLEHQGPIFYPSIPQHTEWGDIIPPIAGVHGGLNWTSEGQAIYNNNCNFPQGEVEVNKKVDTDGNGTYEGGNTTAHSLGFRWGMDGENPTRAMGSDADAFVGQHSVTEKMVNGYVFTGWYYTSEEDNHGQHQVNCTYPQGTTLPVTVNVEKNKTKKVTFCNQAKNGRLTIIKDAQPNDDQNFYFEIDKQYSQWDENFTLDDDGNTANSYSNTKSFDNLPAGTYVVSENDTQGWVLDDITCSEGASVVVDKEHGKATITLGHDDSVTCTFVNQKKGKIKVYKHTQPDGDQTKFAIEATTNDGAVYSGATRWIADGESEEFWVGHGTYTVNEALPYGWIQTENTCENVVVDQYNLYKTCHITNAKAAKLKIKKDAQPADGTDFHFTSGELGDFTLDDDNDGTYSDTQEFSGLAAGSYTIGEAATAGWDLTDLYCYGTRGYDVNWQNGSVSVALKAGDNVTCKFKNEKRSAIEGFKFEDTNMNGEWDEEQPGLAGWTITLTRLCAEEEECDEDTQEAVTDEWGYYSFTNLTPGTYLVCEEQRAGWVQTHPQTEDGCHEITLDCPGTVGRGDFGNFKKGKVTGVKFNDVNGNGKRDAGEPTLKNWTINLYEQSNNEDLLVWLGTPSKTVKTDDSGAFVFEELLPGTYKVCETQQANWTQTFPTGNGCHEIVIDASGQVVTADFGNKAKPQVLGASTLVNTGASTGKTMLVGLTILSILGAVHFLSVRRKDYAK